MAVHGDWNKQDLIHKARTLRSLHQGPGILILPNIWDPLGARLLEARGFPAVATASAAVAYSLGYDDGEQITLSAMLDAVRRIAASVKVPVTADVERGYAGLLQAWPESARQVLQAGAVGINLEDSLHEGGPLRPLEEQCARIAAVRAMAHSEGIPLVINARTDLFLGSLCADDGAGSDLDRRIREAIARGQAYGQAGADCFYPIGAADLTTLSALAEGTHLPLNVYAREGVPGVQELERVGVRRLSLGPNLLRAALHAMDRVIQDLQTGGGYRRFGASVISSKEIQKIVRPGKMPPAGS